MTDIVERLRDPATPIVMRPKPDPLRLEAADEIERLRTRQAIQFGMHPGGDLAKAAQAERDKVWTEHLIERENLKAEITRLSTTLKDNNHAHDVIYEQQLAEIGRLMDENEQLKLDRQGVKRAIEELLERYAQVVADTPHYGVGRSGLKPVK